MRNRIYISGKITGEPDHKAKFKYARFSIEQARRDCTGKKNCRECIFYDRNYITMCRISDLFPDYFEVVNPAEFGLEGKKWWWCMVVCLFHLSRCKYVYMLSDWEQSRGARREHKLAKRLKKIIIYQK